MQLRENAAVGLGTSTDFGQSTDLGAGTDWGARTSVVWTAIVLLGSGGVPFSETGNVPRTCKRTWEGSGVREREHSACASQREKTRNAERREREKTRNGGGKQEGKRTSREERFWEKASAVTTLRSSRLHSPTRSIRSCRPSGRRSRT
eukprot:2105285-Rhodomonas_salina.1